MIWHVIARENADDAFTVTPALEGNLVNVELSGEDRKTGVRNNLAGVFNSSGVYPSETSRDMLKLSIAIYAADKSANRNQAFNKWSRYFHLYQPVSNPDIWKGIQVKLEKMLNFLTGDHWEIHFRQARKRQPLNTEQSQVKIPNLIPSPTVVALMSGGLDSFTGAIDLLETAGKDLFFVSHYGRGGVTKAVQDQVYIHLRRYYPDRFCNLQFFIQPAEGITGEIEPSQRGRSLLFLSLGVAVASAYKNQIPLYIYENGLLSLNVPLAANRGG